MAQSLSNRSRLLEKYSQVVREDGLNTNKNVNIGINGATPNLWVAGDLTVGGTFSGATGALNITSNSGNALSAGPNGVTNPSFTVDASAGSAVTGIGIIAAASGLGARLLVRSSATDEALVLDAKGAGGIAIGTNSTGTVAIGRGSGKVPIFGSTLTSLATQSITPTAAQILGGFIEHASTTGAGTFTFPTASNIITAINQSAAGDTFQFVYMNTGNQTVTLTANTNLTIVGTVAILAGKTAFLSVRLAGAGLVVVYSTVSA